MSRSHRLSLSRAPLSLLLIVAASGLAACTFGPRDAESPPDDKADKLAEATAHEGENKVDKNGFRTPDGQRVMEDGAAVTEPGVSTAPGDATELGDTAEPGDASKDSVAPEQPTAPDSTAPTSGRK